MKINIYKSIYIKTYTYILSLSQKGPMRKTAISIWHEVDDIIKQAGSLSNAELTDRLIQAITHPIEIVDWSRYAHLSTHKYTRNLIHPTFNHKDMIATSDDADLDLPFQLVLMGWSPGQYSLIHDHAGSECCMRVLSGCLREDLYAVHDHPDKATCQVTLKQSQCMREHDWTSIKNSIGWHRVGNGSTTEPAFSLHLYYPPIGQYKVIVCDQDGQVSRKTTVRTCRYDTVNGLFDD